MTASTQEDLFRQSLAAHQGLLWRVVRAFAKGSEDQEDLLQEILLQLWQSLPSFRGDSKAST
jgi:RNA polymerase sigma-70 factor, ECF subfamily